MFHRWLTASCLFAATSTSFGGPDDAKTTGEAVGAVAASAAESTEKARRLLEMADRLASIGEFDTAREAYEAVSKLCPGGTHDNIASRKLAELDAQRLVGAGESEAGLSLTGHLCWNCLSQVEPGIQLKWLDEAFAAYSKAIDDEKPKEAAIYRQVIRQLSPETFKCLDKLKPREINTTVRWRFLAVTYSKKIDGKQSLGFGVGVSGK